MVTVQGEVIVTATPALVQLSKVAHDGRVSAVFFRRTGPVLKTLTVYVAVSPAVADMTFRDALSGALPLCGVVGEACAVHQAVCMATWQGLCWLHCVPQHSTCTKHTEVAQTLKLNMAAQTYLLL